MKFEANKESMENLSLHQGLVFFILQLPTDLVFLPVNISKIYNSRLWPLLLLDTISFMFLLFYRLKGGKQNTNFQSETFRV